MVMKKFLSLREFLYRQREFLPLLGILYSKYVFSVLFYMTMRIETDLSCPLCANSAQKIILLNALKVETIQKFKKAARIRIEHTRTYIFTNGTHIRIRFS